MLPTPIFLGVLSVSKKVTSPFFLPKKRDRISHLVDKPDGEMPPKKKVGKSFQDLWGNLTQFTLK